MKLLAALAWDFFWTLVVLAALALAGDLVAEWLP